MGTVDPQQLLQSWWQYFDYCFNFNPSASTCESFWGNVIGAFIGIGVLMVLIGAWKVWDYRRKARRAAIAEWERNSIDEAGIKEAMWRGEEMAEVDSTPDEDLVAKIRAGVEQRKREVASSPRPPAEPSGA